MLVGLSTATLADVAICKVTQVTKADIALVTVNCTAGNLKDLILAQSLAPENVIDLEVTGTINQVDFAVMRDEMTKLVNVDLSAATVEGCTNAGVTYAANEVPKDAFSYKQTLASVKLPSGITTIAQGAFSSCGALTSVTMPNTVTTLGNSAFMGCQVLTTLTLSTAVETMGDNCFTACLVLPNVTFGPNLKSVGAQAFMNCAALTEIHLPEGFNSAGVAAFAQCSNITNVVIPSTLTNLSTFLFALDTKMVKIINLATTPQTLPVDDTENPFYGINVSTCYIYVPVTSLDSYRSASGWSTFTNIEAFDPTAVNATTTNATTSFNDGKLTISSSKMIKMVEIMSFDGKLLARQHCNNTSCNIEVKGVNKVIAKIVYQDETSQTTKLVEGK